MLSRAHAIRAMVLVAAITADALVALGAHAAPVVYVPGWTVKSLIVLPPSTPEGITVDGSGRVYVCAGNNGIYRIDSTGAISVWSTASGEGQAMLANGEAYVPSRGLIATDHIWHMMPDGSYGSLTASVGVGWTWAAVTPTCKLYANVWGGPGKGLYSIDPSTGAYTQLVNGGPGPGGNGAWFGMINDGETIFISGSPDAFTTFGIYSWNGTALTTFAATSSELYGLCAGPDGIYGSGGAPAGGAIYRVTAGGSSLFAAGFGGTVGVAYDPGRQRFFVLDQSGPAQVWMITKDPTPARSASWGQVKEQFR